MKRAIIIIAALTFVVSLGLTQEPPAPGQTQQTQAPQQPQETKYTNDSVARLSYVTGKTFIQRASELGYEDGVLNMPVSEGDRIGTTDGRAEIHFGRGNYIRLDNDTKVDILNLPKKGDEIARIRVWSGNIYLVVGTLRKEKSIEVHSADSSFYILDRGIYRIDVRENQDTEILVFSGLIEAAGEGGSTLVKADQKLEMAEGRISSKPSQFMGVADDGFDRFNQSRNTETGQQFAKRYLPEEMSDYESELDQNGKWAYQAPYGNIWIPNGVDEDWRPYWNGRWVWLGLTGWTWLPYESWGWATFHYGRWHWGMDLGWYWIPMNMWGPGWVNWWWDDSYFGWAPMSYWGYPGVLLGGQFYGGYYGGYYPYGSRALTIIRRDQLKAPNVSHVALRDQNALRGLTKMSLTNQSLNLRPVGTKITVQPINGNRVMLKNSQGTGTLVAPDRGIGRDTLGRTGGQSGGPTSIKRGGSPQSQAVTAPKAKTEGKSDKSGQARSSGPSRSSGSSSAPRKIHKKDEAPSSSYDMRGGYKGSPSVQGLSSGNASPRSIHVYPSSPTVSRSNVYGDGGISRSNSFLGRYSIGSSGRFYSPPSSVRSGGSIKSRSTGSSSRSSGSRSSVRSSGSSSRSGGVSRKH